MGTENLNYELIELAANNGFYFYGGRKNIVKLENGKYIFFNFGEHRSKLNFILENLDISIGDLFKNLPFKKNSKLNLDFNCYNGDLGALEGKFFISKKGSPFFDITDNARKPHLLVRIKWLGCSLSEKGGLNPENIPKEAVFSEINQTSSMAGRAGTDYIVLPIKSKLADDINVSLSEF